MSDEHKDIPAVSSPSLSNRHRKIQKQIHAKGSVRHAEKRRVGTCAFADNVAKAALAVYRARIAEYYDDKKGSATCIAAIVAFWENDSDASLSPTFEVVGLGVGTKFLRSNLLFEKAASYGTRIRDCHAEVLARRAFQRYLSVGIQQDMANISPSSSSNFILTRIGTNYKYELRKGVSLHFYSSSAPCGNACVKKFAEMRKEKFDKSLGTYEWPNYNHERIAGHSWKLGQFALLLKRDDSMLSGICKDINLGNPSFPTFVVFDEYF